MGSVGFAFLGLSLQNMQI